MKSVQNRFKSKKYFTKQVVEKIHVISVLDHSTGYELSLKCYEESGTLDGIEGYLKMQKSDNREY